MFGKLIATGLKLATLPLDVTNATIDIATGGDGSKRSRSNDYNPLSSLENVRDEIADSFEEMD